MQTIFGILQFDNIDQIKHIKNLINLTKYMYIDIELIFETYSYAFHQLFVLFYMKQKMNKS